MASSLSSKTDPEAPSHEEEVKSRSAIDPSEIGAPEGVDLLALARETDQISREFHSRNLTKALAQSYRAWRNEHASWSKYLGPGFKGRSRLFVPKTRMAVRKNMAAVAGALFSTDDVANVTATYQDDPTQLASAAVRKELLNYRLMNGFTTTSINWFMIAVGGMQDAQIAGVTISKQYWDYEEIDDGTEEIDVESVNPVTGQAEIVKVERPVTRVVRDRPMIELVPLENCSMDPAAPWFDPIGLGVWFSVRVPIRVCDAKTLMSSGPKAGVDQGWLDPDEVNFTLGRIDNGDQRSTTRRAREGGQDRFTQSNSAGDNELVWMVERFVRIGGRDYHFWTIGDSAYASRVQETKDVYPAFGGDRPFKMGVAGIETHRPIPMSPVESWQPLNLELNDISNLRLDTLKRSIAPLLSVKRGAKLDMATLQRRGQPETVLQVNQHDDVSFVPQQPPPGAAYTEGSVGNALFDELSGSYSTSSVQSNRQLNETVGGMKLLSGSANSISEFDVKTWVETWAEPALRQVDKLIAYYESDETAFRVAGAKAEALQRFGVQPTIDQIIAAEVTVRINIGLGSADPMQRLAKMKTALDMLVPLYPIMQKQGMEPNVEAIADEIFGHAGFKDGRRFFTFTDPQTQPQGPPPELQELMEKMKIEAGKLDVAREKNRLQFQSDEADRQNKLQIEQIKGQKDLARDAIKLGADHQARQEQRLDTHVARQSDQNFARENREHESMEARVGRLHDAMNGKAPGSKAVAQQPQPQNTDVAPPPSGEQLALMALLQRLDRVLQQGQSSTAAMQQLGQFLAASTRNDQQSQQAFLATMQALIERMNAPKTVQLIRDGQDRAIGGVVTPAGGAR